MSGLDYRSLDERVLDKVNAARVAAGLNLLDSLPKGVRGSSSDCPLARAFRDLGYKIQVSGNSISGLPTDKAFQVASACGGKVNSHNGEASITPPNEFREFVNAFDERQFPQYDSSRVSESSYLY